MKKEIGDYIIFPLNCLSLNVGYKFLIKCILCYGIINILKQKYNIKDIKHLLFRNIATKWSTDELDYFDDYFIELIFNIDQDNTTDFENPKTIFLKYKILWSHNKEFENKYGKDANVLINTELLNDILNRSVLTERQFRILCAIYSKIGKSPYQFITNEQINFRLNGYKTENIYKQNEKRFNKLSKKILKKEIILLGHNERNFFDRVQYGRRTYIYSRTIRGKKLENIALRKYLKAKIKVSAEDIRNKKLAEKCKSTLSKIKSSDFDINKLDEILDSYLVKASKAEPKYTSKRKAKGKLKELRKEL